MRKSIVITAAVLVTGLSFSTLASAADSTSWTGWNSNLTGTLQQNGSSITVTYTGDYTNGGVDYGAYIYDVPSSFTNTTVTNTPGSNGTIDMSGGGKTGGTFSFSKPVINPVMDIFSLGQVGVPASYVFNVPDGTISLLAGGTGHWGGQSITLNGSTVNGAEGNGLIQFKGTFSSISFTTPQYEYYYGATVGALTSAVPEPETYGMMLAGLGLLGFMVSRKKSA